MEGDRSISPMTGVWWDLNTCPVPHGFDVGLVRPSIELALERSFLLRPVTIFAVGNLEDISHDLLEKISSSGILLRHTPSGGREVYDLIHLEWCNPSSGFIMLISGDPRWFSHCFTTLGKLILRAYDGLPPEFPHYRANRVWGWESLLKAGAEYSHSSHVMTEWQVRETLEMTNSQARERESLPAWHCFLCKQTTKSFDDFTKHLKSEYHMNEVPSYEYLNHKHDSYYCERCLYLTHGSFTDPFSDKQGDSSIYPMIGVWWDLNTCPVPAGFDVGLVRPSIELALKRSFSPRPVAIIAVGNLDNIPLDLLEKISSCGIGPRHAPSGGRDLYELIRLEWSTTVLGHSALLMLISSDPRWFGSNFTSLGKTILRAYDGPGPEFSYCPPFKVWGWESLLKERVMTSCEALELTICNARVRELFPAFQCALCYIFGAFRTEEFDDTTIQSFDDVIKLLVKHLKSEYHKNLYLRVVPSSKELDNETRYFPYFCRLCHYPTYDNLTLAMHYNSEVHAQKAALEFSSEEEARIAYQPNTSREKEQEES